MKQHWNSRGVAGHQHGYTVFELLIVISVIALTATVGWRVWVVLQHEQPAPRGCQC